MWAMSHLPRMAEVFSAPWLGRNAPIAEFVQAERSWKISAKDLHCEYLEITNDRVKWIAGWYTPRPSILQCGSHHRVPLLGARGCISYAPSLVCQQLGYPQQVPDLMGLEEVEFTYGPESRDELDTIVEAWTHACRTPIPEGPVFVSGAYFIWRERDMGPEGRMHTHLSALPEDHPMRKTKRELADEVEDFRFKRARWEETQASMIEDNLDLKDRNEALCRQLRRYEEELRQAHEREDRLRRESEGTIRALESQVHWLRGGGEVRAWRERYEAIEENLYNLVEKINYTALFMIDEASDWCTHLPPIPGNAKLRRYLWKCWELINRASEFRI